MFRRTVVSHTTKTKGYVYWRQSTMVDLSKVRKTYLLTERPFPVAEVARRMVKVKKRYEETHEYQEQTLLRGEYKFFSGKPCDLRGASIPDMIAVLDCAAFFGFWDVSLTDRIVDELGLWLTKLGPEEMVHLLVCLPGIRHGNSRLYEEIARRIAPRVEEDEVMFDEAIQILRAAPVECPETLMVTLIRFFETKIDLLEEQPDDAATILEVLSGVPVSISGQFMDMIRVLKRILVERMAGPSPSSQDADGIPNLNMVSIADVCDSLATLHMLDDLTMKRAQNCFYERINETCPRSVATAFNAVCDVDFCKRMSDRVVFLTTDLDPVQLFTILRGYSISIKRQHEALTEKKKVRSELMKKSGKKVIRNAAAAATAASATSTTAAATTQLSNVDGSFLLKEISALTNVQNILQRTAVELLDQLLTLLQTGNAFFLPHILIGYLQCLKDLSCVAQPGIPHFNEIVQQVCSRCTSRMKQFELPIVVNFLQMAEGLKGFGVLDASITAALDAIVRLMPAIDSLTAVGIYNALSKMEFRSPKQRQRVTEVVLPQLRRAVNYDHAVHLD